jgi:hypothetical protein
LEGKAQRRVAFAPKGAIKKKEDEGNDADDADDDDDFRPEGEAAF